LLLGAAALCLIGAEAVHVKGGDVRALILLGCALPGALLSFCFRTLTVRDGGDALQIRFGPIPLFQRRVPYALIDAVRPGRSTLMDGWGVHWAPGRGWTWNLWGRDCVECSCAGKTLRIGSDDCAELTRFLSGLLAERCAA